MTSALCDTESRQPIGARLRGIAAAAVLRAVRRCVAEPPPIVVGGTGGSGTRAVQNVLTRGGAFMGIRLNGSGDAMDFEPFLDEAINRVLAVTRSLDYSMAQLPTALRRELLKGFASVVDRYRQELPVGMRWGWKNGRSMYLLPLIHARFPEMSFVHVIRDGRDMAYSENRNQLRKHYQALFGEMVGDADDRATIRLWAQANLAVARWGERNLGHRYHRVRFEDLCEDPVRACAALAGQLALPIDLGELLASSILPPPTLGRWQWVADDKRFELPAPASEALVAFGYN